MGDRLWTTLRDEVNKLRFNVYVNVFCYVYNVKIVVML